MSSERNKQNQTLEEFLAGYNAAKYPKPSVTCDVAVITKGKILLIRRGNHPCINLWALPGGFLDMDETAEQCAARELKEETSINVPLRQLFTVSSIGRDPRGRAVTICFTNAPFGFDIESNSFPLQNSEVAAPLFHRGKGVRAGDDAAAAEWFDIEVSIVDNAGCGENLYRLTLKSKSISLFCVIEAARDAFGKMDINAAKYIENKGIAFDHGKIILKLIKNL